jgi:hypothetical protein
MTSSWITVGLSAHRVETLTAAEQVMTGHRVVALEEPPTAGFAAMLAGRSSVGEHLDRLVPEFPEYSRHQCTMLRKLHRQGMEIVQVEPFMAELEAIHDVFDGGGRPGDLESDPLRWRVYQAEKKWTGALLTYYAASGGGDFHRVVDAVVSFAHADAERGRLRDTMRADRLAALVTVEGGVYAEAGHVHADLIGLLRRRLPAGVPVRPRWLMARVVLELSGRSLLLAPGDRLTLACARKRPLDPDVAGLLAARSLIQVAMSVKEELLPTEDNPFPHTVDDVRTCQLVGSLTYEDCRNLYPTVRSLHPTESRAVVERYLSFGG